VFLAQTVARLNFERDGTGLCSNANQPPGWLARQQPKPKLGRHPCALGLDALDQCRQCAVWIGEVTQRLSHFPHRLQRPPVCLSWIVHPEPPSVFDISAVARPGESKRLVGKTWSLFAGSLSIARVKGGHDRVPKRERAVGALTVSLSVGGASDALVGSLERLEQTLDPLR
jgi:hypothetical protein